MSSRGKKKTTMAKLNREARLRERRSAKVARKEARREAGPTVAPNEFRSPDGFPLAGAFSLPEDQEQDTPAEPVKDVDVNVRAVGR